MKILRMPDVVAITGLSSASIYKQIRLGHFPEGIKLTARCTGWALSDVEAWIKAKRASHNLMEQKSSSGEIC